MPKKKSIKIYLFDFLIVIIFLYYILNKEKNVKLEINCFINKEKPYEIKCSALRILCEKKLLKLCIDVEQ
jgi:hypothetical protein